MSKSSSKVGRWIAAVLAILLLLGIFVQLAIDNRPKGDVRQIQGYTAWEDSTLKVASAIPVQDGGRTKPLSTYAGFKMLGLHGARSMKIQDGQGKGVKITPTVWLMDTLFRPQLAIKLPTFRVDNSAVLEAIGVKPLGKRDRYSYEEIQVGRTKLIDLAKSYEGIDKEKREFIHEQTIALAYNLRDYESLLGYFGFARFGVTLHGSGKDGADDRRADMSAVMLTAKEILAQISHLDSHGTPADNRLRSLMQQVLDGANFAKFGLLILPPADSKEVVWLTAGNAIHSVFNTPDQDPALAISDIALLESVARSIGESEATFRGELTKLRDNITQRATARGEGGHVGLEIHFYQMDWFLRALACFILGTILAFAMCIAGRSKAGTLFAWGTWATTGIGVALCVIAIVQRCLIMQRPPVGNLYDTIIFIAAAVGIIGLIVELMTRRRFALGLTPILGAVLILIARRFEVGDAKDNMGPLIAVLDSNYWLTTHVLTITLGYAAGFLSAFLSIIYLLMRGLRLDNGDREIQRSMTRAVYGMVCLTLFLSLIGTVLGGIWANDSWGRFWGWDPKENGALLIVLWTLSILHARLGGYIKEWGLHLASVFTAAIVAFSWWHVNFLGVGLHNYGFTAGKESIWIFYTVILVSLVFGMIAWGIEKAEKQKRKGSLPPAPDGLLPDRPLP
jgi:ABC-type transport system involved in cytochrome c biogenesis permease subunit